MEERNSSGTLTVAVLFLISICSVAALSCSMGYALSPVSVDRLLDRYGLPAPCQPQRLSALPRSAAVIGSIDPANLFDRRTNPRIVQEKFVLLGQSGRRIEVWLMAGDNGPLFDRLEQLMGSCCQIVVEGDVKVFRIHTQHACRQAVRLEIHRPSQVRCAKRKGEKR